MTIAIHEFSTGINVQGTANNWRSVGFTGYMNCTIDPIPPVVQNAISNHLFAVSEGDAINTPAMVGREVEENGEAWSVLAVVSRANDEKGRGISVYRYFLTEGKGKLSDLVRWHSQSGGLKFNPFDSKTLNEYHEYTPSTVTNTDLLGKAEFKELLRKEGTDTIIVPNDLTCPPLILNELALRLQVKRYLLENYKSKSYQLTEAEVKELISYQLTQLTSEKKKDYAQRYFKALKITKNEFDIFSEVKAANSNEQELDEFASQFLFEHYKGNGFKLNEKYIMLLIKSRIINHEYIRSLAPQTLANCTIAWGYNVKGLTKPASFQAIFPVSEESRNILGQNVKEGLSLPAPVAGEYPIITVSRDMIFQGNVKPDYINILEKAFSNPLYTPNFWEDSVFKPLGLENAQKDTTYSPSSLRLLMLRALTIPSTLTDFISGIKSKSQNKQIQSSLAVANQLSETLKNQLPKDSATIKQVKQGIDTILIGSNAQALQDLVEWINRDSQGLWGKAYQEYCLDFWQDIEQIAKNYKTAKADAYSKKGLYIPEDKISASLKNGSYYVSHAPQNLVILSQTHWELLRDDMIELIWTYKGKSKYLALHNSGLYSKLADFFADMSYQKQLESKSLAATHNLALLFTGLTNPKGIPAKLWEKSLLNLRRSDKRTEILKSKDSNVQILAIRKIPTIRDSITDWIKQFIESAPQLQPLELRLLPIVIYLALGTLLGIILEKQVKISSILTPTPINDEEETLKKTTFPPQPEESKPLPSPAPTQSQTNIDSLNALVTEMSVNYPDKPLPTLKLALAIILSRNSKTYEELIDPTQAKQLIDLAKKYQGNNGDGKIDIDGATYNQLKCDVAKGLMITLKNPPTQCPKQ